MTNNMNPPCAENRYVGTASLTDMTVFERAIAILNSSKYGTLSTVSPGGRPWGSPIFFVTDAELNLYWSSAIVAQHSINLAQSSGQAMMTMYQAHDASGNTQGLYLRGSANVINDEPQATQLIPLMMAKSGRPMTRTALDYLGESSRRFYRFTPEMAWITGDRLVDGNQLIDTKIALDVAKLKEFV